MSKWIYGIWAQNSAFVRQKSDCRLMPLALLMAAAAVATFLSGCEGGRSAESRAKAKSENALVFALATDVANMDPALITDVESSQVAMQVYQGLVQFATDSVEVEPCLAERWEVSPDGLLWTFYLREGVKFQDGTPLTSEAVVFSVMRQMDENHPFHVAGKMRYANLLFGDDQSTDSALVIDVDNPEPLVATFTLARPYTPFLKNLAMTPACIVNPDFVRTMGADFNTTMSGTGPFRLARHERDQRATLVRNDSYWGKRPALDEIQFRVLRDPNARLNSVRRGDSDIITGIEPNSLQLLEKDKNVRVLSEASMNIGYLGMNNAVPPFDNPKVRLALNYAINRDYLCDVLFQKTSVPAKGMIPPGMLGYDPDRKEFEYDPGTAKELLKEAGYPNGFTVKFSTHDRPRIYSPVGVRMSERIQRDLSRVGITATIDQMEFSTFLQKSKSGDYALANGGWISDNGDPDNFIYELAGREDNSFNYKNPGATMLMRQAAGEKDEAKRAEMYRKADDMLQNDPPVVFLNNAKQIMATRLRVENFKMHPTGSGRLEDVRLAKLTER